MSKKSSTFAAENKIQMLMETEIKFDQRNYRKHSKKNKDLIRKSLEELGAGRSVVIDNENELVAGNGVYEQERALKMPVRIVETDGSELVVVKRTDLATESDRRKKLALADNSASDLSEWDDDLLHEDWSKEVLADWGVEFQDKANNYSRKVEAPVYNPTEEVPPPISDCVDTERYEMLIHEIESAKIKDEDKTLLRLAAARHIVFDYRNIAERYAHAEPDVQRLMEDSALVIIDFGRAIENGFVRLTKRLQETIENDEK